MTIMMVLSALGALVYFAWQAVQTLNSIRQEQQGLSAQMEQIRGHLIYLHNHLLPEPSSEESVRSAEVVAPEETKDDEQISLDLTLPPDPVAQDLAQQETSHSSTLDTGAFIFASEQADLGLAAANLAPEKAEQSFELDRSLSVVQGIEQSSETIEDQSLLVQESEAEKLEPSINLPLEVLKDEKDMIVEIAAANADSQPVTLDSVMAQQDQQDQQLLEETTAELLTPEPIASQVALEPMPEVIGEAQASINESVEPPVPVIEASNPPVSSTQGALRNTPRQDDYDNWFDKGVSAVWNWLTTGNPFAKVGVLLLFLGLGYLVRFTAEYAVFPVELRFIFAGALSFGLLVIGWLLRHKKQLYATILQGGGVGGLYLTVVGASVIIKLLPLSVSLGLLIVLSVASIILSLLQNAYSLALLATIGGYLAPLLVSTGSNNYVGLFSYYLIISCAVLGIAYFRAWRGLNVVSFLFSVVIAGLWGWKYYKVDFYLASQGFLIANLLLFAFLSQAYVFKQGVKPARADLLLALGVPIAGFVLQYLMVQDNRLLSGVSALSFAGLYLIFTKLVLLRNKVLYRDLIVINALLVIGFVVCSIPLALTAQATAVIWTIAASLVVGYGYKYQSKAVMLSGLSLQVLVGVTTIYLNLYDSSMMASQLFLIDAVVACSVLVSAVFSFKASERQGVLYMLASIALIASMLTAVTSLFRLTAWLELAPSFELSLIGISFFCILYQVMGRLSAWRQLEYCGWALLPISSLYLVVFILDRVNAYSILSNWFYSWIYFVPVVFGIYLSALYRKQLAYFASFSFWQAVVIVALELGWHSYQLGERYQDSWVPFMWTVALVGFIGLTLQSYRLGIATTSYQTLVAISKPLWVLLPLALILFNQMAGFKHLSTFIPLFNPLEQSLWLLWITMFFIVRSYYKANMTYWMMAGLACLMVTVSVMRSVAYYQDLAWQFHTLWASVVIQTALSIIWASIAFILVIYAQRRKQRFVWKVGAGILAVVTLKLLLKDAWAIDNGLYRAVSFIGVALIFIVLGYFAPLPPVREQTTTEDAVREE
ncbi:DUF2339 domain-containing protein [Pseudomonas sp. F1_0610]|uniref:DUF2339 domain-containing protein n=1 Tax=Pseudomonas sp. F1_0610 TaxID=3114284 RepID=UPI0039C42E23